MPSVACARRPRPRDRGLVGAERARQRAVVAQVAGEAAGVDPGDARARRARASRSSSERSAAPVARAAREVAHDHARAERAAALVVGRVDAVVADVRVGEGDDLPRVRRVGDDLLVARQRGVEHDLAGRDAAASAPIASPSNVAPSASTSSASHARRPVMAGVIAGPRRRPRPARRAGPCGAPGR